MSAYASSKDFYRVLRVPHTATLEEIKVSYRRLALRLHPDMHKNDPQKTKEFKLVNEAYAILSDEATKKTYDFDIGNRYNRSRRTPPPPNYRYVAGGCCARERVCVCHSNGRHSLICVCSLKTQQQSIHV